MNNFFKRKLASAFSKLTYYQGQYELQKKLKNTCNDIGKDIIIDNYFSLELPLNNYFFKIGDGVIIRKFCNISIHSTARLTIEKRVFLNNYCSVNCLSDIYIGANTLIGEGVKIYDHNHKYNYDGKQLKVERETFNMGSIKIGNNCWIGSNVTILKNVEIGDNVIIGANNLIYKSIPPNTIVKSKTDMLFDSLE